MDSGRFQERRCAGPHSQTNHTASHIGYHLVVSRLNVRLLLRGESAPCCDPSLWAVLGSRRPSTVFEVGLTDDDVGICLNFPSGPILSQAMALLPVLPETSRHSQGESRAMFTTLKSRENSRQMTSRRFCPSDDSDLMTLAGHPSS
jgi:hypothetical protein